MSALPIGLFTASLPDPIQAGIAQAQDLGLAGVQLPAGGPGLDPATLDRPARADICARLRSAHLELSALCGDLPGHGFSRREGLDARVAATRSILDLAADLGAPVVSAHVGVIPADPAHPRWRLMAEALSAVGDHARERGVRYAIETGPEPAAVLCSFLDRLGNTGLAVNFDPANLAMVQGEAGPMTAAILASWTAHVHVKDGIRYRPCDPEQVYEAFATGGFAALVARTGALFAETPLGQGAVDWRGVLRELRHAGYRGFLTIEREMGGDHASGLAAARDFLNQIQETVP